MYSRKYNNNRNRDISPRYKNDYAKRSSQSEKIIEYLNSIQLSFVQFYASISKIQQYHLSGYLNERGKIALNFCFRKDVVTVVTNEDTVLRWMIETSYENEPDADNFQDIIDHAIIKLITVYHDNTILNNVVTLMFKRYCKDQCIYDLCWAYYQSRTIQTMPLVASYLRSDNTKENQLAYKLLNFKPELQPADKTQQYANFMNWFEENQNYLYFNEENMQETTQPKYWRVNQKAKYFGKQIDNTLSEMEQQKLVEFDKLERVSQKKLAKASNLLYKTNKRNWQQWISSPIENQLKNTAMVGRKKND